MPPIKYTFSLNDALLALLDQYALGEWSDKEQVPVIKMNLKGRAVNGKVFEEAEVLEWMENK